MTAIVRSRLVPRVCGTISPLARARWPVLDPWGGNVLQQYGHAPGSPLTQRIGLGRAERAELLEVFWPTSRTTQTFDDVPAGSRVRVTEGHEELKLVEG